MHFFKSLIVSASALATLVAAQSKLAFTDAPTGAEAGKTYDLKWTGGSSTAPVTILLREGTSTDLKTVSTITSAGTGGSYSWQVPANLPAAGDYALEIQQAGSAPNYWAVGAIAGGSASASASASASSSASASASASSSASESKSVSSLVSSLSSKLSSVTASSHSAGTTSIAHTRNSTTITKATLSTTKSGSHSSKSASAASTASSTERSSSGSSSTSSGATAPSSTGNAGSGLKSNAALVLGAVAAMAYLG